MQIGKYQNDRYFATMSYLDLFERASEVAYRSCLPHVSVDCVVFGFHEATLKVLLLKMKGFDRWGLPGGYVKKAENIDAAAYRILQNRTGAANIYLEQFKVFGNNHRSEDGFTNMPPHLWQKQRFISIGYYALVNYAEITPVTDAISELCEWKDIDDLPDLMMDHADILNSALNALRRNIHYSPIGLNLLPKEFTMPQLQRLYEVILSKKLHRGNFQRKIHSFDILTKCTDVPAGQTRGQAILYSFDSEKYQEAIKNGLRQEW